MAKKSIFILSIILIFICIPLSFAAEEISTDNSSDDMIYTQSFNDDILSAQDVYFNASAEVDGDGSMEHPYKTLNVQRIGYGNTLHFANGVYNLQRTVTINKAIFIGQDAAGPGSGKEPGFMLKIGIAGDQGSCRREQGPQDTVAAG